MPCFGQLPTQLLVEPGKGYLANDGDNAARSCCGTNLYEVPRDSRLFDAEAEGAGCAPL